MTNPTTIARVLDPATGATLAFEITTHDGGVYFVAADPFWPGVRVGPFPCQRDGQPWPRQELARLEGEAE